LPPQLAQGPHLVAAQRMRRGLAVLGAAEVLRGVAAYLDLDRTACPRCSRPKFSPGMR
jgi:hypothetical protein